MKIFGLLDTKYSRFVNSVKSSLSETLSNYTEKYGNATIFGQMINVLSAAVQNIMLYIEDALVEQNKYTAQRKKSIYGLASLSGYNPYLIQKIPDHLHIHRVLHMEVLQESPMHSSVSVRLLSLHMW